MEKTEGIARGVTEAGEGVAVQALAHRLTRRGMERGPHASFQVPGLHPVCGPSPHLRCQEPPTCTSWCCVMWLNFYSSLITTSVAVHSWPAGRGWAAVAPCDALCFGGPTMAGSENLPDG